MHRPHRTSTTSRPGRSRRSSVPTRRYRVTRRGWAVFTLVPLALLATAAVALLPEPGSLVLAGVEDGEVRAERSIQVRATAGGEQTPADFAVLLDGQEVEASPTPDGAGVSVSLEGLADGRHELVVRLAQGFPHGMLEAARTFTVDATPPAIEVLHPTDPVPVGEPVVVRGRVDDPAATLSVGGERVEPAEDGAFEVSYEEPPSSTLLVVATDPVGNRSEREVSIELALPGAEGAPPIRGVHATGYTWATPSLREPILQMIREGRINTVQLDLKDEAGQIWYDTEVDLAHEIGAVEVLYDLPAVVDELHAMGVRVVGRLVVFRDPKLADHAVATGRMDWVVQTPDGAAFGKYGGFTNPFDREVWEYNAAVAEEAARLGVDDVLYDYVRRPDEHIERMRFPGQGDETPEDAIVSFLAESRRRVHSAGARLGASVFGVAATRPLEIAQDIPRMSREVDYIAPMLYPSHWGPGEYGVAHPNAQPYDIVHRSLLDFREQMEGTGAGLVAWLQDFSLGVEYGPAEVRAQIEAAADAGVDDFLLWDAATTYTSEALDPAG